MLSKRVSWVAVAAGIAPGAMADARCDQAFRGDVSAVTAWVRMSLPEHAAGGCRATSVGALQCRWDFGLRDPEARAAYLGLRDTLHACATSATSDVGVNHPDSYDAVTFGRDGAQVRLSLKDKSALGATYLFLQRQGEAGE